MGCGCKDKTVSLKGDTTKENLGKNLTIKEKVKKIPMLILVTIIVIVMSPILIGLLWYISISSILGNDTEVFTSLVKMFKNINKEPEEDESEDNLLNVDDYELLDVDEIK